MYARLSLLGRVTPLLAFTAPVVAATPQDSLAERVAHRYAQLAQARYQASLDSAQALVAETLAFLEDPTKESHEALKRTWLDSHLIYSSTEVFRFGNPNVDAWEGKVNAWPMDEGLIDYVADSYVHHEGNPYARANLICLGRMMITDDLIAEYASGADPKAAATNDITDVESNVTTGYHAVEFLLWGQDLNEDPMSAGQRPHTDFVKGEGCTHGACDRRGLYLSAATRLLVRDLRFMVFDWTPGRGRYAKTFAALPVEERLDRAVMGMGSLSYSEVASERLRVALLTSDQEEEQSCFSDTSLEAIAANLAGIETLYLGLAPDATAMEPAEDSVSALVASVDPKLDATLRGQLRATTRYAQDLVEDGEPLDRLISADNADGHARIEALIGLTLEQTVSFEQVRKRIPEFVAAEARQ